MIIATSQGTLRTLVKSYMENPDLERRCTSLPIKIIKTTKELPWRLHQRKNQPLPLL